MFCLPYAANTDESGGILKLLHLLGLDVSLQEDLMGSSQV